VEVTSLKKRLFFALDLSKQDKLKLSQWRETNLDVAGKKINSTNFHITLAFLGLISSEQENKMIDICHHYISSQNLLTSPPHCLMINKLGLFKRPQVLYLDFINFPKQLTELANLLSQEAKHIGITQEHRGYLPHISLVRKAKRLPAIALNGLTINVSTCSLYHSTSTLDGVVYAPIKTWAIARI